MLSHGLAADPPLGLEHGLYDVLAAAAEGHAHHVVLSAPQQALALQPLHHSLARLSCRHTHRVGLQKIDPGLAFAECAPGLQTHPFGCQCTDRGLPDCAPGLAVVLCWVSVQGLAGMQRADQLRDSRLALNRQWPCICRLHSRGCRHVQRVGFQCRGWQVCSRVTAETFETCTEHILALQVDIVVIRMLPKLTNQCYSTYAMILYIYTCIYVYIYTCVPLMYRYTHLYIKHMYICIQTRGIYGMHTRGIYVGEMHATA